MVQTTSFYSLFEPSLIKPIRVVGGKGSWSTPNDDYYRIFGVDRSK